MATNCQKILHLCFLATFPHQNNCFKLCINNQINTQGCIRVPIVLPDFLFLTTFSAQSGLPLSGLHHPAFYCFTLYLEHFIYTWKSC